MMDRPATAFGDARVAPFRRLYVRLPGQPLIRLPVNSIEDPGFGPAGRSSWAALSKRARPGPAPHFCVKWTRAAGLSY
jgi:hypothetical protein